MFNFRNWFRSNDQPPVKKEEVSREVRQSIAALERLVDVQTSAPETDCREMCLLFGTVPIRNLKINKSETFGSWSVQFNLVDGAEEITVWITKDTYKFFHAFPQDVVDAWRDHGREFLDLIKLIQALPKGHRLEARCDSTLIVATTPSGDYLHYPIPPAQFDFKFWNDARRAIRILKVMHHALEMPSEYPDNDGQSEFVMVQGILDSSFRAVEFLTHTTGLEFEDFVENLQMTYRIEYERLVKRYPLATNSKRDDWFGETVSPFPNSPFVHDFDYKEYPTYKVFAVLTPKERLRFVTDKPQYAPDLVLQDALGKTFHAFSGDYIKTSRLKSQEKKDGN